MGVIGLVINKIVLERMAPLVGKVNINNNAAIKQIEKTDIMMGAKKQDALKFVFEFKSDYEPNLAYIMLIGDVLWMDKQEQIEDIKKQWDASKKISPEIMTAVINTILARCTVEALILSRELNLPSPIPVPRIQINNEVQEQKNSDEVKKEDKKTAKK